LLLFFFIIKKAKSINKIFDFSSWKTDLIKSSKNIQIAWIIGLAVVLYVLYAITAKSLYWPTIHYDSIAGYDFLAKAIAHEGTINNSLFDTTNKICSYRTLYPPLFPINFAYAYIMGFELPKIITALYLISLAIIYYAYSRKFVNPVANIFFLALLLITPEMLAQSAMLMTNVPQAAYTLGAVGAFFIWNKTKEKRYFVLSIVCATLGVWGRSEGIIFGGTLGIILLIYIFENRKSTSTFNINNIKKILYFAFPLILIYAIWEVFLKVNHLDQVKQPFSIIPFYDAEKIKYLLTLTRKITFETSYYGYIINLFFIVFGLSIILQITKKEWDRESNLLITYIFVSIFFYLFVYYQIKVPLKTITGYITNGYKRGIFNIIPILALYISNTVWVRRFFNRLYFPAEKEEKKQIRNHSQTIKIRQTK